MSLKDSWKQLRGWVRVVIVVVLAIGIYSTADYFNLVPGSMSAKSLIPKQVALPSLSGTTANAGKGFTSSPIPGTVPARLSGPPMRIAGWAWSSQMGLWYAMGGNVPMDGSLMAKYGSNIYWYRQDDVSQMQNDLVTCATEMSNSGRAECASGATHVSIMWDGAPAFVTAVNAVLERLGPDYTVEYIGSLGYSRGEDKLMGLPEWKRNPQSMRGALIAGVIGDGDWNVALNFMGNNQIPNNPDEKTYDPDAVNWVRVNGFLDAAEKYITGFCEPRPVIKNGRRTGETRGVCVNGVVTWTPGDVNVAKKKGGLVSIASTKEYSTQMANAIIGIRRFDASHPDTIVNFFRAAFEGGDNIKFNPQALPYASKVSADVYREETAAYWKKYYEVQTESDKQGFSTELGGSYANNLADNLYLFGLMPGSQSIAVAVYTTFGDILSLQYPKDFPKYVPASRVINTQYIETLRDRFGVGTAADLPTFSTSTRISEVFAQRSWSINFVSGSANFTPDADATLQQLFNQLMSNTLAIEVQGHTDSVGDAEMNQTLSERRAWAVRNWLEGKAPANFPKGRINVRAFGESMPIAPNDTEEGRAKNRRVEIVLGTTR